MKCIIVILFYVITAFFTILVNADADYEEEEKELSLCAGNEVYKEDIYEKDITRNKLVKKNTSLKCRCYRLNNITEEQPGEYPDPIHTDKINISYSCPHSNETDLPECGRHAFCQRDIYDDYGEEKPNEKYIDYSLIYCNCSKGRSCVITNKNPNDVIYKCIENKYDAPLPPCKKNEFHMVRNYAKQNYSSGVLEVPLNTSLKCSCNNHEIHRNYSATIVGRYNQSEFTEYRWCPEHLTPSKRVRCRENQVSKKTYFIEYGRDKPGESVKVTSEYCTCGPPPKYHTLLKFINENEVDVNRATYRCNTRVCRKDEVCATYVTTNYFRAHTNETTCQCNQRIGRCQDADFVVTENGKESWLYKTCNQSK